MAPTNILREGSKKQPSRPRATSAPRREILIRAGRVAIRARLLDTTTADRIWTTLPIYSTAETWGKAVHFETHAETGREKAAKWNVAPGEIAFWAEEDRILIGFGMTPLSRPGEIRLPCPCNIWAVALDDVAALAKVHPGERVAVLEADS
ncbi:MAG: cyclophilin-like family protein [Hyphomicrobiaceae bacterium]